MAPLVVLLYQKMGDHNETTTAFAGGASQGLARNYVQ